MTRRCWHCRRVLSDWCGRLCSVCDGCWRLREAFKFECKFLDPWVSRRTLLAFILLDVVGSSVLLLLFLRHKALGKLWLPDFGWKVLAGILIFRLLAHVFGTWAVIRRNTSQVRCYYFVLVFNFLSTVVLARPLLLAKCTCFESAMGLVALDAVDPTEDSPEQSHQCDVWNSFFEVGDFTRRLGAKWPNCKQRIHGRAENERREGLGLPIPDLFNPVDLGIKLEGEGIPSDCTELELLLPLATALDSIGCGGYDMRDWATGPFRELHRQLQECFSLRSCGGVGIVLKPSLLVETDDKSSCGKITVCRHYYPLKPSLDSAQEKVCSHGNEKSCPVDLTLYLLKDVEKFECFRFGKVSGPATRLCKFAVQGALCLLLLLDIVTLPAFKVIRKYLRNSCGDFIEDDIQFDVDFADDDGRPSFASSEASFVAGAHAPSPPDGVSWLQRSGSLRSWRGQVSPGATSGVVELAGIAER
eukprot:s2557_g7.t1